MTTSEFVVSRPEDIEEIHDIVSRTRAETGSVILMPEGTDPARLRERRPGLPNCARRRDSVTVHGCIWIFGATGGAFENPIDNRNATAGLRVKNVITLLDERRRVHEDE